MARRPTHVLNHLIRYRILRAISAADGWGLVYLLFEGMTQNGEWIVKIGMTIDLIRRLVEHNRVCPNPARVLLDWVQVNFRRRQVWLIFFGSLFVRPKKTRGVVYIEAQRRPTPSISTYASLLYLISVYLLDNMYRFDILSLEYPATLCCSAWKMERQVYAVSEFLTGSKPLLQNFDCRDLLLGSASASDFLIGSKSLLRNFDSRGLLFQL
ncbi:hypothetical protein BDP27DRAFT_1368521 [Rhodocollybia butyracea]|uniref:Uncharacterized protein n=1 Tax=Rhodocollybia butyracea TaxID=206335 RepID=A0A9P5PIR8_9AGAR|nr:hypothetical protein BDP27DRAFT_1368521 [Rhodocollybia butyracea]